MPTDALAPNVASAGTIMAVQDKQHILLLQSLFQLLGSSQIQDIIQNVNIFIIVQVIQHVKSW